MSRLAKRIENFNRVFDLYEQTVNVIDFKTLAHEGLKRSIERDGIVFYKQNN